MKQAKKIRRKIKKFLSVRTRHFFLENRLKVFFFCFQGMSMWFFIAGIYSICALLHSNSCFFSRQTQTFYWNSRCYFHLEPYLNLFFNFFWCMLMPYQESSTMLSPWKDVAFSIIRIFPLQLKERLISFALASRTLE